MSTKDMSGEPPGVGSSPHDHPKLKTKRKTSL